MRNPVLYACLSGTLLLAAACGRNPAEPANVAADPAAVRNAFAGAPAEVRQEADQAMSSLSGGDPVGALERLSRLQEQPGLTPEQQIQAGQAMAVSLKELHKAATKGDRRAQDAIDRYKAGK